MPRGIKRRHQMASDDFARIIGSASKWALVDALWCACQLGTDESKEQITAKAARELSAALVARGDRVRKELLLAGSRRIDADGDNDWNERV